MKRETKLLSILALLLLTVTQGALAQIDASGQKVKRITFDREQVSIEYADGTTNTDVQKATIVRDNISTGVKTGMPAGQTVRRIWYTTDGRQLQGAPRKQGVYVVREKNSMKKTIKK